MDYYEDRSLYLKLRLLPQVKFFEKRGINLFISSSEIERIIDDLENKRRPLSKKEAKIILYECPADLQETTPEKLGFFSRAKYALLKKATKSAYNSAFRRLA